MQTREDRPVTALRAIGIDLQGGKGNASNFPDAAPTLCAISHGTPNAALLYAPRGIPPFPVWTKPKLDTLPDACHEQD